MLMRVFWKVERRTMKAQKCKMRPEEKQSIQFFEKTFRQDSYI